MSALDDLRPLATAVLARIFVHGEKAALDTVPADALPGFIGRLWRVAAEGQADGRSLDLVEAARLAEVEINTISAELIDEGALIGVRSAQQGIERIADVLRRQKVAQMAEALPERIASGNGLQTAEELTRTLQELHAGNGAKSNEPLTLAEVLSMPTQGPPWIFEPLLAEADNMMIAGAPGTLKSMLAMLLSLTATTGHSFLDIKPNGHRRRVLIIDAENPGHLVPFRVGRLLRGMGLHADDVSGLGWHYYATSGMALDEPGERSKLFDLVRRTEADTVVFDALVRFCGRLDPNKAEDMARLFREVLRPLNDQGVATVTVHHTRKPPTQKFGRVDPQDEVRGSSELAAAQSSILVIHNEGDERTVLHAKNRHGPRMAPLTVEMVDDGEAFTFNVTNAGSELEDQVVEALASAGADGVKRRDLVSYAVELGLAETTADRQVSRHLGRLLKAGKIARKKEGRGAVYWLRIHAPEGAETA